MWDRRERERGAVVLERFFGEGQLRVGGGVAARWGSSLNGVAAAPRGSWKAMGRSAPSAEIKLWGVAGETLTREICTTSAGTARNDGESKRIVGCAEDLGPSCAWRSAEKLLRSARLSLLQGCSRSQRCSRK